MSICPSCGAPTLEPAIDTQPPPTPLEVSSEVERLDSFIATLQLRRAALLRQLNQTQPLISVLPPETLAFIFENVCQARDFQKKYGLDPPSEMLAPQTRNEPRFQFTLGAVSSCWRRIVKTTPRLWTTLDINITPESGGVCSQFLTNSASLPISLGFHWPKPCGPDQFSPSILSQASVRIQELHIDPLYPVWAKHISQMPNLKRLSVQNGFIESPLVVDSPCTFLLLSGTHCRPHLRWLSLTVIHLYEVAVDVGLDLLVQCTNLIEFRFQNARDPELEGEEFRIPQQHFILPFLKVFEWSIYIDCEVDMTMLRFITMPALQGLIWREQNCLPFRSDDPRPGFLQRLPSSLVFLDINSSQWDTIIATDYFSHIRSDIGVEDLRLTNCSEPVLSYVLQKLTPADTTGEDEEAEKGIKFPKLQSLTLIAHSVLPTVTCLKLALSMLEARFLRNSDTNITSNHDRKFLLHFKGPFPPRWDSEDEEKIKELAAAGVEITPIDRSTE